MINSTGYIFLYCKTSVYQYQIEEMKSDSTSSNKKYDWKEETKILFDKYADTWKELAKI